MTEHMWDHGGPFFLGWLIPMVLMVLFWGTVIFLLVSLIRGRGRTTPSAGPAMRILEDRYARGEIDRDEFLERRRVLAGEAAAPPTKEGPGPPPAQPPGEAEPTTPIE